MSNPSKATYNDAPKRAEEMGMAELAAWYLGAADRWPDHFPVNVLAQRLAWATANAPDRPALVQWLRASLLKQIHAGVNTCTLCALHENRLPNRGVVEDGDFDNDPFVEMGEKAHPLGPLDATIMVVAEGPGQYEQRTGQPFVSTQVLMGSVCARECGQFESCYGATSPYPMQPCKPVALRKTKSEEELIQVRIDRANLKPWAIDTSGSKIDLILWKSGLWRQSWNSRQSRRSEVEEGKEARPGTVYMCNIVKCRASQPNEKRRFGVEDRAPTETEAAACFPWLEMQHYIIQPQIVVCLGAPSTAALLGITEPKILSMRGGLYPSRWGPVLVEIHPAYILYQNDPTLDRELTAKLIESFNLAQKVAAGTVRLPWKDQAVPTLDVGDSEDLFGPPSDPAGNVFPIPSEVVRAPVAPETPKGLQYLPTFGEGGELSPSPSINLSDDE